MPIIEHIIDRQIDRSLAQQMLERLDDLMEYGVPPSAIQPLSDLHEALSGDDWNRLGVVVALLWSKLDQVITALKTGNAQSDKQHQAIERFASEVKALAARLGR